MVSGNAKKREIGLLDGRVRVRRSQPNRKTPAGVDRGRANLFTSRAKGSKPFAEFDNRTFYLQTISKRLLLDYK